MTSPFYGPWELTKIVGVPRAIATAVPEFFELDDQIFATACSARARIRPGDPSYADDK
jgi:hypothetical protein